jgi:hypothetical protein
MSQVYLIVHLLKARNPILSIEVAQEMRHTEPRN